MNYIIQIDNLYDYYNNMNFGYIGKDLNTGKIHYYSKYDRNGNYSFKNIIEFDIKNTKKSNSYLARHLQNCHYIKNKESTNKIPLDINNLSNKVIQKHLMYNKKEKYPLDTLIKNSKNLTYKYVPGFYLLSPEEYLGSYIPIENIIEIPLNKEKYEKFKIEEKNQLEDVLLHEIGHLKVSTHLLDLKNKLLKVRTGFYTSHVIIEPILLNNQDIFLKFVESKDLYSSGIDRILEEVMNDYECKKIKNNFNITYPNVGNELNNLCDGRLQKARYYEDGIEELYDSLTRIINSRELVTELLNIINEVSNSSSFQFEKNNNQMIKILTKYKEKKYN